MESKHKVCLVGGGANEAHCPVGREVCQELRDLSSISHYHETKQPLLHGQ